MQITTFAFNLVNLMQWKLYLNRQQKETKQKSADQERSIQFYAGDDNSSSYLLFFLGF